MKAHPSNKNRGFTLIEILVVVLIVSIMSGIAVTQLPSFVQSGDFDLESLRVKTLLDMAREEALVQASEFGFKPNDEGYAFYQFDEESQVWVEVLESPFHRRILPEDFFLDLQIAGQKLELSDEKDPPPLLLLSSGEVSPFTLRIYQKNAYSKSMKSDGFGDIVWAVDP
ncbi:MAG: general secretion pathway protein H [Candidatus Azotimanducaceae bacterium]|jgi:general secretion pathway protein H